VLASSVAPVFSRAEPAARQSQHTQRSVFLPTLQICPLDYAHSRPATQRPRFPRQLGRNCPKVFRESRDCQTGLIENVVQPS
jgi:hypothetical protein